ncbi:MAG: proline racemase family protein [Planctomycetaceae bacterium]
MQSLRVIDSHTGGEPTRVIIENGPNTGHGTMAQKLAVFRDRFDDVRSAVINEPRGSDVLVGALLCEPHNPGCDVGVIFFNNTGYLGMCGHGTIGLMVTLRHLGRVRPGLCRIDTPVGVVTAELLDDHRVSLRNVPAWRYRRAVTVNVPGHGSVTGDIAWGGNWFYLVSNHGRELSVSGSRELCDFALQIRAALESAGITGANGGVIDHIELFGPPSGGHADSRNFVMCPGGAWDRSPCGTGTSAKLACLAADGKLAAGAIWRQESLVGSVFTGHWEALDDHVPDAEGPVISPTITGSAWITAESILLLDDSDPFRSGIRPN